MASDTATLPALSSTPATGFDPEGGVSAADKIFRQFCRYLGIGYCLSFVGLSSVITRSLDVVPMWWTVATLLSVYGSAIVMIIASFRPDIRAVRAASSAVVIGYALTIVTWPLVWNGVQLDVAQGMWFTQFNGVVAFSAALTWRVRWSLPYWLFVLVSVQFVNDVVRVSDHSNPVAVEIAWSFCLTAMPYAMGVAAIRSGRILDTTRHQSATAAAEAAADVARAHERSRLDALTHDGVMATLLAAARHDMSPALVEQATDTLTKLEVLESGVRQQAEFDVDAAISQLRSATGEVDDSIRLISFNGTADPATRYPGTVVRTMSAALAEALRNSVQHAGPGARRSVQVRAGDNLLRVTVGDNGLGFDSAAVPGHRLGLAVSVRGRMKQLPGGSAEIASRPGEGTRIDLTWRRPQ